MNYPIPTSHQEIFALKKQPIDAELVAAAIAGVVHIARTEGKSLSDLKSEVLADDRILDQQLRWWLSEAIAQAWEDVNSIRPEPL